MIASLVFGAVLAVESAPCPEGSSRVEISGRVPIHAWCQDKKHLLQGPWRSWHSSGKSAVIGQFADSLQHGKWTFFASNGTIVLTQQWDYGVYVSEQRGDGRRALTQSCLRGPGKKRFPCAVDEALPSFFWMSWGNSCPDCEPDDKVHNIGNYRHFNTWSGLRINLDRDGRMAVLTQYSDSGEVEGWTVSLLWKGQPPDAALYTGSKRVEFRRYDGL